MRRVLAALIVVAAAQAPLPASAQTGDVAYCEQLSTLFDRYLGGTQREGRSGADLDARIAVEKCRAGDASGIPILESRLRANGFTLPKR